MVTIVGIVSLGASQVTICEDIFTCTIMGSIGTCILSKWFSEWFDNQ